MGCLANNEGDKYTQCDYLQYDPHGVRHADEKVVSTYIQRSPSRPYYTETDNLAQFVQQSPRTPYSHDRTQVSPYLSRVLYDPHSDSQSSNIYYCVQDPGLIPSNLDHTVYSSSGSASSDPNTISTECSVHNSKSYSSPLVNQSNVEEIMFNTQKKRTLVKHRFPDVLPSEKVNQNYYV